MLRACDRKFNTNIYGYCGCGKAHRARNYKWKNLCINGKKRASVERNKRLIILKVVIRARIPNFKNTTPYHLKLSILTSSLHSLPRITLKIYQKIKPKVSLKRVTKKFKSSYPFRCHPWNEIYHKLLSAGQVALVPSTPLQQPYWCEP